MAYITCGQGMGFGGYQTALCFSRQRGVGVAVLCNAGSDSYELSQACPLDTHKTHKILPCANLLNPPFL